MWGVEESQHLERVNTYRCNIYRGWTVHVGQAHFIRHVPKGGAM